MSAETPVQHQQETVKVGLMVRDTVVRIRTGSNRRTKVVGSKVEHLTAKNEMMWKRSE